MQRGFESCGTPDQRKKAPAAHNRGINSFQLIPAV
jgi:hypothetical protein